MSNRECPSHTVTLKRVLYKSTHYHVRVCPCPFTKRRITPLTHATTSFLHFIRVACEVTFIVVFYSILIWNQSISNSYIMPTHKFILQIHTYRNMFVFFSLKVIHFFDGKRGKALETRSLVEWCPQNSGTSQGQQFIRLLSYWLAK